MVKVKDKVDTLQQKEFLESMQDIFKSHSKQRKKTDAQKINRLKKMLSKTEMGREALQFIKDNKIKILIDNKTALGGYCVPRAQTICIQEQSHFYYQISTLIHELRHAWQDKNNLLPTCFGKDNGLESRIYNSRIVEADSNTHQVLHAIQLNEVGVSEPLRFQLYNNKIVAEAMVEENKKTGSTEKILLAGFNAWLSNDKDIEFYDNYYMNTLIRGIENILKPKEDINILKDQTKEEQKKTGTFSFEYITADGYNCKRLSPDEVDISNNLSKLGESFAKVNYTKSKEQEILNNPRCFSIFLKSSVKKLGHVNKLRKALSTRIK